MQCVRIWFRKNGRAKYISHLDLMRAMTRAVNRAGIPLWYTEGFNPHPYLTFPLPLTLGVESDRECMDIKVEDGVSLEKIKEGFDGIMPEGLEVYDVTLPFNDAKEIGFASYRITLDFRSEAEAEKYAAEAEETIKAKNLTGRKRGKQGKRKVMKEVSLAEHIFNFVQKREKATVTVGVRLSAGCESTVNPLVFLNALNERTGISPEYYSFYKEGLYTSSGEIFT